MKLSPCSSQAYLPTLGNEALQPSLPVVVNTGFSNSGGLNIELFSVGIINQLAQWGGLSDRESDSPLTVTLQTGSEGFRQTLPLQPLIEVAPLESDVIPGELYPVARLLIGERKAGSRRQELKLIPVSRSLLKADELYEATNLFAQEEAISLNDELVSESENISLWFLDEESEELVLFLAQTYKGRVVESKDRFGNTVYDIYLPNGSIKHLTQDEAWKEMEQANTMETSFAEAPSDFSVPEDLKLLTAGGGDQGKINFHLLKEDMQDLINVWEDLAFAMRYPIQEVEAIRSVTRGDQHKALERVLTIWSMQKKEDWNVLIKAINRLNIPEGFKRVQKNFLDNPAHYYLAETSQTDQAAASSVVSYSNQGSSSTAQRQQQHNTLLMEKLKKTEEQVENLKVSEAQLQHQLRTTANALAQTQKRSQELEYAMTYTQRKHDEERNEFKRENQKLKEENKTLRIRVSALEGRVAELANSFSPIAAQKPLANIVSTSPQQSQTVGTSSETAIWPVNHQYSTVSQGPSQDSIDAELLEKRPEMYVLNKTKQLLQTHWQELAENLGVPDQEIRSIEADERKSEKCVREVFLYMITRNLKGRNEGKRKTYSLFIDAVKELPEPHGQIWLSVQEKILETLKKE